MAEGKKIQGTFSDYAGGESAAYPDDEEAIYDASENMLGMCGNAGQESLIGDNLDWFAEWGVAILENAYDTRGSTFGEFAVMVLDECYGNELDKWWGTYQIWFEGWADIAYQSGYHDSYDEMGEGTGQEFG